LGDYPGLYFWGRKALKGFRQAALASIFVFAFGVNFGNAVGVPVKVEFACESGHPSNLSRCISVGDSSKQEPRIGGEPTISLGRENVPLATFKSNFLKGVWFQFDPNINRLLDNKNVDLVSGNYGVTFPGVRHNDPERISAIWTNGDTDVTNTDSWSMRRVELVPRESNLAGYKPALNRSPNSQGQSEERKPERIEGYWVGEAPRPHGFGFWAFWVAGMFCLCTAETILLLYVADRYG